MKEEDDSPGFGEIVFQVVLREEIQFIDNGGNWQEVRCPRCKAVLADDWWTQAMDRAHGTKFAELSVKLPCCGWDSNLNDLEYDWPAGFARFSISVKNPVRIDQSSVVQIDEKVARMNFTMLDPDENLLARVGAALGCPVRKVRAHY